MDITDVFIIGSDTTTWKGNFATGVVIDKAQGFETYNCSQCQNKVYLINGDETNPGALASNHILDKYDQYRYGNFYKKGPSASSECENCVESCFVSCFSEIVEKWTENIAEQGWTKAGYFEIQCKNYEVSSDNAKDSFVKCSNNVHMYKVQVRGCCVSSVFSNSYANVWYRTDDSNVQFADCFQTFGKPSTGVNVGHIYGFSPAKQLIYCRTTVDCVTGVTPVRENPNAVSENDCSGTYSILYYAGPNDTTFTCTNRNSSPYTGAYKYTNIGQGYCDSCNGCNAGCTVACVRNCVTGMV